MEPLALTIVTISRGSKTQNSFPLYSRAMVAAVHTSGKLFCGRTSLHHPAATLAQSRFLLLRRHEGGGQDRDAAVLERAVAGRQPSFVSVQQLQG